MSNNSAKYGFNSSTVLHHTEDYLIEKYIPGESLNVEKHGNCKLVWIELGRQMKLVHSIPGDGFSNRIRGETSIKFPIYDSYYDKMLEGLKWEDTHVIPGVDRYLTEMLEVSKTLTITPVHLHYDVAFDNIIVTTRLTSEVVGYTVTLIDFADAGMGDRWEDFAFLYCNLSETPQLLAYIYEGYGGVSCEDIRWIEFYCVVWLTWALSGDDQPKKRASQLRVAARIVEKGLMWLDSRR
jgi:aminoglycoside phosphotransferase (APT) family kinase protein